MATIVVEVYIDWQARMNGLEPEATELVSSTEELDKLRDSLSKTTKAIALTYQDERIELSKAYKILGG